MSSLPLPDPGLFGSPHVAQAPDADLVTAVHAMRDGDVRGLGDLYDVIGQSVYLLAQSLTNDPSRASAATVASFTLVWRHARDCPTDPARVRDWVLARALASIRAQLAAARRSPESPDTALS